MPDIVYDAFLGAVNLRQVTNSQFSPGIQILAARNSGSPLIVDQFFEAAHPEAQITTTDISGFLSAFGTLGSKITDGSTVILPWQKRATGGTVAGAGANMVVTGVASCPVILVPQSINVPRMGPPSAQGHIHFLSSDGVTAPWATAVNQTLTATAFNLMHGLGPVYINSTLVPKQVGFNMHFGLGWSEKQHYSGAIYPTDMFEETQDPSLEISHEDFDLMSSLTGGAAITQFTAYLRKRASGGSYVADATAVHTKISFAAGVIVPQQHSAADTKHGQAGIRILGRTLVISTSSAVTAP